MKIIHTENAPAAIGPYSQAIVCGNLLFTSGQIPLDPATGAVAEGNQVTLTWTKLSVSSCTYTIEGAKGSGAFSVFAEDLT